MQIAEKGEHYFVADAGASTAVQRSRWEDTFTFSLQQMVAIAKAGRCKKLSCLGTCFAWLSVECLG